MEHIMNNLPGADGMQERFEVARSANYVQGNAAVRVHVICREEQFYLDVPHEVLSLGP